MEEEDEVRAQACSPLFSMDEVDEERRVLLVDQFSLWRRENEGRDQVC